MIQDIVGLEVLIHELYSKEQSALLYQSFGYIEYHEFPDEVHEICVRDECQVIGGPLWTSVVEIHIIQKHCTFPSDINLNN